MCGIAGIVGLKDRAANIEAVKKMTAHLARRGPDDEGVSAWDGAVLGHRRLAIFDDLLPDFAPLRVRGSGQLPG